MHGRGGAGHQRPPNAHSNRYMEVPHGDPFQNQSNQLLDRGNRLGLGPPPRNSNVRSVTYDAATPIARRGFGRSTSFSPDVPTAHASSSHEPGYMDTPTQAHRYYAMPRSYPVPPELPTAESKLDRLMNMVQTLMDDTHDLKQDNQELKERVAFLESNTANSATTSSRGITAQRGKTTRFKARSRRQITAHDSGDSDIDPALLDEGTIDIMSSDTGTTDLEPNSDADGDNFSPDERKALQKCVTQAFRRICNVSGKDWPDPDIPRVNSITGETYPTPFFDFDVTDARNQRLFREVGREVLNDLTNRNAWPPVFRSRPQSSASPPWDLDYLMELAKKSFRNLKVNWTRTHNYETGLKADVNARTHRHTQRRVLKSKQIRKVIKYFAAKYGVNLQFLLDITHEQYLSDEASGPEDAAIESPQAWKVHLASLADVSLDPRDLSKRSFLEVMIPPWRSDVYSDLIHQLEELWFSNLSVRAKAKITYIRVNTNRISPRLPNIAPYNFGFSKQWLRSSRTDREKRNLLTDWGKYPEPDNAGFPPLAQVEDDEMQVIFSESETSEASEGPRSSDGSNES
ncbi:hypothetical protein C8R43DRAFT_1242827 [Mycena crocata]|nr:hypothetical protein C8R43DRAFT_1242827 [Mycena crocata]